MTDITDLIERDPVKHALAARLCIEELRRENARLTAEVRRLNKIIDDAGAVMGR